ncbi:hypothetical protein EI94DRAFT_1717676 [Lactarius quietus]|nr:hypothetical protein EI94DRAFT_1717676 [Lactarius quietus]
MSDPIPFVVTEALSKVYYKGLPSHPRLIATTKPDPFEEPSGPEAYSVLKELKQLGDHPLAMVWDGGLSDGLRRGLNTMRVNWTSIDALRIAEVGESSNLVIVWIGVELGALSFAEGSVVAHKCRTFIDGYGIQGYHVEIRESRVMRQAGNRFFDPVPLNDPTFSARDPYTATLEAWAEGTGGFYLSAGGDDRDIYLVTARHVVLPVDNDHNELYERTNVSKAREDVVVLGTSSFNQKLTAIENDIRDQEIAINEANQMIQSVEGMDDTVSVKQRRKAEQKEKRIFGELVWAPPIALSTEPGQYTLDLAVIRIDAGKLDAGNYRGNSINLGNKYTAREFMDKIYLNPTSPSSFKLPIGRIVTLKDQVPESALVKLPMLDANGEPCLVVFKNGAQTGTTIGKANNVSSYTRTFFVGQYQESREWPIIPTDKYSGVFSAKGDSGSCIADAFSRIGGILTGGAANPNLPDSADVTYATPITFIMKVLHDTKRFAHAHLNPVLA